MKKILLSFAALAVASAAMAFPKAIYVKQGDTYTKYNFGVAGDLVFSDGGKTLKITGYSEAIDLSNIDYITFTAPVDDSALTPASQKQKMIEIGEEVNSMVSLNDNAELVRMVDKFFHSYWDGNGMTYTPCPSEYEVPQEYWDVHNAFQSAVKAVGMMMHGNPAGARVLKAKTVDLYRVQDYFGIYNANETTETWERIAKADYLEIRFRAADSDNYVVKLEASDTYTTWNTVDFNGQMPTQMTLTFLKGQTQLATAVIKTTLVQNQKIDMSLHFEANGYVVDNTMNVVNDGINDVTKVTVKGKELCNVTTHIDGRNLVNYDVMYDDVKEALHYHDAAGNCCGEDPHGLLSHFVRANTDVDVIGKLQVKGKVFGLTKIYDSLSEDADIYDVSDGEKTFHAYGRVISRKGGICTVADDYKEVIEDYINHLNNYTDASFYYDGKKQMQGFLAFDIEETQEELDYSGSISDRYGYTIVDGYLVSVMRDAKTEYDPKTGQEIVLSYSDWYYRVQPAGSTEFVPVTVKEPDVFQIEVLTRVYYDVMPLLVFPDLTNFAFEDFFDEVSFKKLIDDYNDIISTYDTITGQNH